MERKRFELSTSSLRRMRGGETGWFLAAEMRGFWGLRGVIGLGSEGGGRVLEQQVRRGGGYLDSTFHQITLLSRMVTLRRVGNSHRQRVTLP